MTHRGLVRAITAGIGALTFSLIGTGCLEKKSSFSDNAEPTVTFPDVTIDEDVSTPSATVRSSTIPSDGTPCGSATANAITTIGLLLDESDLLGSNMDDSNMGELGNTMGQSIGLACDDAGITRAFSQIVVYLGDQQGTRRLFTEGAIGGILSSICGAGLTLTPAAQQVCAGSS